MAEARWTKLRDDTWGVRVIGRKVKEGSIVGVKKTDGTITEETIEDVVWEGDDDLTGKRVYLCHVRKKPS